MTSNAVQRCLMLAGMALLAWFVVTFIYLPIGNALTEAFIRSGEPTTAVATDLFASKRVRQAILNTAYIAILTVITVNIVGIFQVVVLDYVAIRGAWLLRLGYATPLVFSSVVAAAGYKFAYGDYGILTKVLTSFFPELEPDWFRGWPAVLYAHTFLMTSYHFLFLRAAIRRIDFSTIEAARSLGASHLRTFILVVLPLLLPTILAASLLVMYESLSSLAIPLLIGGREFSMVAELILALNSIRRSDMAALLALLLGGAIMICMVTMQYVESRGSYIGGSKTPVRLQKIKLTNPLASALMHMTAYGLFLIYVFPVALTVLFSFAPAKSIETDVLPSSLTIANYLKVFSNDTALIPFLNSVLIGLMAAALALTVSLFAVPLIHQYRNRISKLLDLSLFIPWILPTALLAIGMILAFDQPNHLIFGQVLIGTFWILPLANSIVSIPMMVRFLRAAFWSLDQTLGEAATALGASQLYSFRRITFPLVFPVVCLVGAMEFNRVVSEYTLAAFLYNVNNRPLSIALVEGARDPDPDLVAINMVYMTLIMGFSFIIIMLAEKYGLADGRKTR